MRISYCKQFAGFVLSAGLLMVTAQTQAPVLLGPSQIDHARIAVHRADDGSIKRGVRNEMETSNWSGYALANFSTGATYTAAQLSWTVPKVSYVKPPPVCHVIKIGRKTETICSSANAPAEYSSSWVGIGGYCENANCTAVDNTLIQLGTEQDVSSGGSTQYYAWIEMLPNYPVIVSPTYPACNSLSCAYAVHPGDAMTASLACQSNCTPGASQTWLLSMANRTRGWNWSTTVTYASTLLSAVWIQEAPSSSAGVLPLADFGTATLDPTVNAGSAPVFPPGPSGTDGVDAILMVDPYGETSNPSIADASPPIGSFNACWGNNASSIATCPVP
ncbi:MAG TPA: G1 family glutamic endopeptidase [Stellaceae bacterium]|nr:G1 family glutamic endopeptidase [Stellaceae bacterium]